MPEEPSERIGCRRASQPLKSPTTWTSGAAGAQTANDVPRHALELAHVRAEPRPQLLVAALADQVQVEVADRRQEAVGILELDRAEVLVVDLERVVQRQLDAVDDALEDPGGVDRLERMGLAVDHGAHRRGGRAHRADDDAAGLWMRPEDRVRVGVLAPGEALEVWGGGGGHRLLLPFPASAPT